MAYNIYAVLRKSNFNTNLWYRLHLEQKVERAFYQAGNALEELHKEKKTKPYLTPVQEKVLAVIEQEYGIE